MSLDIRLPNITGTTETEQLQQIRSYLYQLAPQLNWALSTLETQGSPNVVVQKTGSGAVTAEKDKDRMDNFNELKHLIIKSADIVNAYYEEINDLLKLNGEYVAQSDFGTYFKDASAEISANYEQIRLDFDNLQGIISADGNDTLLRSTTAYIRLGIIAEEDNGDPINGIEIGQTNANEENVTFNQFARFTARELSFYNSSGYCLATFGDDGLVVPRAKIEGNLTLGKYVLDTSNGIAFKWIGG